MSAHGRIKSDGNQDVYHFTELKFKNMYTTLQRKEQLSLCFLSQNTPESLRGWLIIQEGYHKLLHVLQIITT